MGQCNSQECGCHEDGLFAMCAPEDPNKLSQAELQTHSNPGYPSATPSYPGMAMSEQFQDGPTHQSGVPGYPQAGPQITSAPGAYPGSYPGYNNYNEEPVPGYTQPPPEDRSPASPVGGMGSAPPPQYSAPQGAHGGSRTHVTADDILSNLDGAEEMVYGDTFASLGGASGSMALDNAAMRDFICTNTSITMNDVDTELLKVADQNNFCLTLNGFLILMRDFAVSDGDAISQFMGLSADGESLAAEECRTGLLMFAQQKLSANFNDERWECIFNTVMWDAGVTVMMEQWLSYAKTTGRIVRLFRFAQV